jgi:D-alanyl-D-alanine carboxypeptidase
MVLPKFKEEEHLVEFKDEGRSFRLTVKTLKAWEKMKEAAKLDGIHLYLVSAFRSISRQSNIVENKEKKGISEEDIFRTNTPPGYSEHHTGRAIDINTKGLPPLERDFEESDAFHWLSLNASAFGYRLSYPKENKYGIAYEPWHWFYEENEH